MSFDYENHTKSDGRYGPTTLSHYYVAIQYHNVNADGREEDKSLWAIPEPHQYCVFKYADEANWIVDGLIVGLKANKTGRLEIIGANNERIAVFRPNDDSKENWHGYPILMCKTDNRYDGFLCQLRDSKIISKSTCRRLITHKL